MQERAARTRQAVLEAAAEEFAERGYEAPPSSGWPVGPRPRSAL